MNKGHADIPSNWEAVDWEMRLERTARDFGEPHKTNPADWLTITDWERSPEHLLAEFF